MEYSDLPPDVIADFENITEGGYYWVGPRLWTVFLAMNQLQLSAVPGCETLKARKVEQSVDAAVADGEDFEQQLNYGFAVKCYQWAAIIAQMSDIVDLDFVVDLLYKQSAAMLKMGNLPDAYEKACKCVEFKPDFLKGYTMKSVLLQKHLGIRAFPAFVLLSAFEHCQPTTDEQADLIVEAGRLLASVAQDSANGKDLLIEDKGIDKLRTSKSAAKLPESKTVWDQVFQKLYSSQDFSAMALLSVGLPDGSISQLNDFTCNMDVDCSKMVVEQVYGSLSSSDVETWGDRLAIFIVDHGGGVSRQTEEPVGVNLVRLALEQKSLVLLQHVLQTKGADTIQTNQPNPQGDTALHVVVKSTPLSRLHQRIVDLLIRHGAMTDIPDSSGKTPDEYVDRTSVIFKLLHGQMTGLEDFMESLTVHPPAHRHPTSNTQYTVHKQTSAKVERLKCEGKRALQVKDFHTALDCYKDAITELGKTDSSNTARDLAVLYCNMAAVYTSMIDAESACSMAKISVELDPTYHKPYWRLGKVLLNREQHLEACEDFLRGASCREADTEQKSTFFIEICGTLPSLSEKQGESILDRMQQYWTPCWAKIVEKLTKNSQWDAIRRLVLGPPCLPVDRSIVPAGWKYADTYTDDFQLKVGYAMCLKATTHDLSTLLAMVEGRTVPDVCECASDLVLALLLQGAKLETLVTGEDGTSCYHVAVNLCCLTEKLGLMRYILSDNAATKKAQLALDDEKRTLLHSVCLHFSDGEHLVGQKLASLLMEKGFDPAARDILQKRAADYLAPGSAVTKILAGEVSGPPGKTAEELRQEGNGLFKKRQYREAIAVYSRAITIVSAALPSSVTAQTASGHRKEKHELAVLFGNRAECHLKLNQTDKALLDAMESVSWDGHWYKGHRRVGQILMEQKKPERALKAFTNAFNALEHDPSEKLKVAVLKELMKCLVQMNEQSPTRPPNLGYVSGELWTMVTHELLCDGIRFTEMRLHIPHLSWKAGQYSVAFLTELILSTQHPESLPRLQLDLRPLCSWLVPMEFTKAFAIFFISLLSQGSDHTRLSFYKGDTYVHAAVCFTVVSGETLLLDHVMANYIKPKNEENIQDADGNTVLHIVALPVHRQIPDLTSECRESMTEILLEMGMDPSVRNKEGKTPLECLSPTDNSKLKKILQAAVGNCGPRTQVSGASARHSSKRKTPASLSKSVSQRQSKPSSTDMPVERAQRCSDCHELLNDVRQALDLKPEVLFQKLTSVVGCSHPKNSTNALLVSEAVDLIIKELGKPGSSDIPEALLTLSTGYFQQVLEKLAAQNKWLQLQAVVEKALSRDVSLSHFAKSISLKALVCSQGLLGLEPHRVKIFDLLISHGAQLVGNQGRDAMKAALQNGEFLVAERLLKLGTDPRLLTLAPGDSPLQAALEVALKKDTGNLAMLQYLVSLYEHDTASFPFLNPRMHYAVLQAQIEKSDDTVVAQRASALLLPYK